MLPSWCGKDCTGYCPDCYEKLKGEEMSEETLMRETISALHELVEVAFCKEDIEALLHIEKMISHECEPIKRGVYKYTLGCQC
jgi:hypothetical protein